MGILSRFGDIISANINALLDKAEDPAKMVDQYMREAMEDLAEVKKETAAVMAEEKRCKRLLDSNVEDVAKYGHLAERALTADNENDARAFIAKKQECEANAESIEKAYALAHANADKMRQLHDKLVADIETLRARQANIKATMAVANTQQRVNAAQDAHDGARGAMSNFARMEEKANRMLDEANAMSDLNADADDGVESLEKKYGPSAPLSVEDELAALKAKLGKA